MTTVHRGTGARADAAAGGSLGRDRPAAAQRLTLQRLLGATLHDTPLFGEGAMPWECTLLLLDMARDGVRTPIEIPAGF